MIHFNRRRFFPERKRRMPLRWMMWGAIILLFLVFMLFMKMFK